MKLVLCRTSIAVAYALGMIASQAAPPSGLTAFEAYETQPWLRTSDLDSADGKGHHWRQRPVDQMRRTVTLWSHVSAGDEASPVGMTFGFAGALKEYRGTNAIHRALADETRFWGEIVDWSFPSNANNSATVERSSEAGLSGVVWSRNGNAVALGGISYVLRSVEQDGEEVEDVAIRLHAEFGYRAFGGRLFLAPHALIELNAPQRLELYCRSAVTLSSWPVIRLIGTPLVRAVEGYESFSSLSVALQVDGDVINVEGGLSKSFTGGLQNQPLPWYCKIGLVPQPGWEFGIEWTQYSYMYGAEFYMVDVFGVCVAFSF